MVETAQSTKVPNVEQSKFLQSLAHIMWSIPQLFHFFCLRKCALLSPKCLCTFLYHIFTNWTHTGVTWCHVQLVRAFIRALSKCSSCCFLSSSKYQPFHLLLIIISFIYTFEIHSFLSESGSICKIFDLFYRFFAIAILHLQQLLKIYEAKGCMIYECWHYFCNCLSLFLKKCFSY